MNTPLIDEDILIKKKVTTSLDFCVVVLRTRYKVSK